MDSKEVSDFVSQVTWHVWQHFHMQIKKSGLDKALIGSTVTKTPVTELQV